MAFYSCLKPNIEHQENVSRKTTKVNWQVHLKGRIPESYTSRSYGARWASSCWAESAKAPVEQKGRWIRTVVEAGTWLTGQISTHHTVTEPLWLDLITALPSTRNCGETGIEKKQKVSGRASTKQPRVAFKTFWFGFSRCDVEISADRM